MRLWSSPKTLGHRTTDGNNNPASFHANNSTSQRSHGVGDVESTPTTIYRAGDVVLTPFPYADQQGEKKRPVVLLSTDWVSLDTGHSGFSEHLRGRSQNTHSIPSW